MVRRKRPMLRSIGFARLSSLLTIPLFAFLAAAEAEASRTLTFEERVEAQEAIERVYYSHQLGARRPFEEAVPREVLERKVRTYLKQSEALEQFWNSPVTPEALQRELQRIAQNTSYPERLRAI